jgi:hypothetical protein
MEPICTPTGCDHWTDEDDAAVNGRTPRRLGRPVTDFRDGWSDEDDLAVNG